MGWSWIAVARFSHTLMIYREQEQKANDVLQEHTEVCS
jgi:hypothetical protein